MVLFLREKLSVKLGLTESQSDFLEEVLAAFSVTYRSRLVNLKLSSLAGREDWDDGQFASAKQVIDLVSRNTVLKDHFKTFDSMEKIKLDRLVRILKLRIVNITARVIYQEILVLLQRTGEARDLFLNRMVADYLSSREYQREDLKRMNQTYQRKFNRSVDPRKALGPFYDLVDDLSERLDLDERQTNILSKILDVFDFIFGYKFTNLKLDEEEKLKRREALRKIEQAETKEAESRALGDQWGTSNREEAVLSPELRFKDLKIGEPSPDEARIYALDCVLSNVERYRFLSDHFELFDSYEKINFEVFLKLLSLGVKKVSSDLVYQSILSYAEKHNDDFLFYLIRDQADLKKG